MSDERLVPELMLGSRVRRCAPRNFVQVEQLVNPTLVAVRLGGSAPASGAQVGASQGVLGTDHPIPWEEHPVDHVMATTTLSLTQRAAILGGNAAKLLNIKEV